MRYICLVLVFGALVGFTPAVDPIPNPMPVDPIHFPVGPVLPTPPAPRPDAIVTLQPGTFFIVGADKECTVDASPDGLVTVSEMTGPVTLRGKFVDGTGEVETKTYKYPFIYDIQPAKSAKGRVDVTVRPVGGKTADGRKRTIQIGESLPDPKPIDPPAPKPVDPPIADAGLHVLIVYDDAKGISGDQQAIITGQQVRTWLDTNCVTELDGKTKAYRIFRSTEDASGDMPVWSKAMSRPRSSLPWLIVSNGKTGFEGPLPGTAADFVALASKYK